MRGSRQEERAAAAAETEAARAAADEAARRYERLRRLAEEERIVSPQDLDQARRDHEMSRAARDLAVERERLVNAHPLPEEMARIDAEISAAIGRARESEARVDKCTIAAPVDATVLRVHLREGEQVSLAFPRRVVSRADTSAWRVRAELDERDLGRVHLGQPVRIEWDAQNGSPVTGRVVRVGPLMGRKRVRTGDPAEKSDRGVQEVIIDLDPTEGPLVIGFRVTVFFLEGSEGPGGALE